MRVTRVSGQSENVTAKSFHSGHIKRHTIGTEASGEMTGIELSFHGACQSPDSTFGMTQRAGRFLEATVWRVYGTVHGRLTAVMIIEMLFSSARIAV